MKQIHIHTLLLELETQQAIKIDNLVIAEDTFRDFVKDNPDLHTLVTRTNDLDEILSKLDTYGISDISGPDVMIYYSEEFLGESVLVYTDNAKLF